MTYSETAKDKYVTVSITTDGSGDATGYATIPGGGYIEKTAIGLGTWVSGAADVTLTDETGGETIIAFSNLAASPVDYPRRQEDDTAGSGTSTYTRFFVPERVKIVVADGGDTKTGTVTVYFNRS